MPSNGDIEKLWLQLGILQRQLWDASRQMDHVARLLPKDGTVRRARKDVNAALHSAFIAQRGMLDAWPSLPKRFIRTPPDPVDGSGPSRNDVRE